MTHYSDSEKALIHVWEAHMAAEFEQKDADAAIAMMTDHPVLVHVPVNTGATGRTELRRFYKEIFIPQLPPDTEMQLLSRSVGQNRLIDEFILRFTHTLRMDWFAPGIDATGCRLVLPHVAVISFENGMISAEHIYWDQATVLTQMGILDKRLPVIGDTQCDRLLDANASVNQLIKRGALDA